MLPKRACCHLSEGKGSQFQWNGIFLKSKLTASSSQLAINKFRGKMNSGFCWINCWPYKMKVTGKLCQVWSPLNQSEVPVLKVSQTAVVWDSRTNGGCWPKPIWWDAAQSGAYTSSLRLCPRQSGTFLTELNPPSLIKSHFSTTLFGHCRAQRCMSNLFPHRLG